MARTLMEHHYRGRATMAYGIKTFEAASDWERANSQFITRAQIERLERIDHDGRPTLSKFGLIHAYNGGKNVSINRDGTIHMEWGN